MENKVILNIETKSGKIVIPFIGLKELDCFTMGYNNDIELIESLSKMLNLSLNVDYVLRLYITSDKYKDRKNSSLSCIKYSGDNYNIDSLGEMLSLYLKQDHRRIRNCDVRFVITDGMVKFNAGKDISDRDIDIAVKVFLKVNYKKHRDMYFMIKNFGGIRIDKLAKEDRNRDRMHISKMSTSDEDSFVQYLIELASRNEDKLDKVIDELSRVELEDISRVLEDGKNDLFDGFGNGDTDEDLYALESLTEMNIEQIIAIQDEFSPSRGSRR